MTADLGVTHSPTMWIELHGDNAIAEARRLAADMRGRGDLDGADTRPKIIAPGSTIDGPSNMPAAPAPIGTMLPTATTICNVRRSMSLIFLSGSFGAGSQPNPSQAPDAKRSGRNGFGAVGAHYHARTTTGYPSHDLIGKRFRAHVECAFKGTGGGLLILADVHGQGGASRRFTDEARENLLRALRNRRLIDRKLPDQILQRGPRLLRRINPANDRTKREYVRSGIFAWRASLGSSSRTRQRDDVGSSLTGKGYVRKTGKAQARSPGPGRAALRRTFS